MIHWRTPLLLSTLCFLAEVQHIAAQKKICPSFPKLAERLRPLSTTSATMTEEFQKDRDHRAVVANLVKHYRKLGSRSETGVWVCQTEPEKREFLDAAKNQAKHFGWPPLYYCLSKLGDGGRETYAKSKELFQDIKTFSESVANLGPRVLKNYGLHWKESFSSELLTYDAPDIYRSCDVASSLAYRLNGQWGVAAMLTNISTEKGVREPQRGYFKEPVSLAKPLALSIPTCPDGNFTKYEAGTAIIATWGGVPSWSHFSVRDLDRNPAVLEALNRGNHEKELVEDSDTLSNLSILLLPSVLALVPIGLFQDVSLSLTLLYALATDVASVLPVAIKGIELIYHGTRTHHATASYLYGAETTTDVAMAETWVASCRMKAFVQEKGIALLTTSMATMLLGIALEFITRASASKFRRRRDEALDDFAAVDRITTVENGGLLSVIDKSSK